MCLCLTVVVIKQRSLTYARHARYVILNMNFPLYSDIANGISLLNTPSNRYLFDDRLVNGTVPVGDCIRCAIVGNGGILNGSRMGEVIDSHDYVFR